MKIIFILFISFLYSLTGNDLVKQMEDLPKPDDIKSNIHLEIKKKKIKKLSFRSIIKDNGKKQIMWFTAPPADKGIAFLKIEKENESEEMRMWLPAFKKIRRISSKKKGDAFMGSDLSYEDLYTRKITDYTFKIINEEIYDNEMCYLLKSIPNKELKSDYKHHISWISKERLIPLEEKSFDKKEILKKEKTFNYKKINDFWILEKIFVKNVQKNQSTTVIMKDIEINSNVNNKLFQEKNLKRLPF